MYMHSLSKEYLVSGVCFYGVEYPYDMINLESKEGPTKDECPFKRALYGASCKPAGG